MATHSRNLIATIMAAHFVATADQVQQLAGAVAVGKDSDATYVRILVAHMQGRLGKRARRKHDADAAIAVLDSIHEDLYPAVLKGVGPDEMEMPERNRRANFARSAASTLRYFINHGGDVRALDVETVTKSGLRSAVTPKVERVPGESRVERAFRKAEVALLAAAQRLAARGDPDEVRERLEAVMDELEAVIPEGGAEQPDVGGTTTVVASRMPSVSNRGAQPGAMLHRPG